MIRLVAPSPALHVPWLEAMREFGNDVLHRFSTFGFEVDDVRTGVDGGRVERYWVDLR